MIEILKYGFFQNALLGSILISLCCGILGTYIVTRRLVFISGGITHASFGGLGIGFFLGINPVITAIIFAVASAFGVEILSSKYKVREDSAIAAFWALGMALGIIFIFMSPGFTPSLTEFLFGNILTITRSDLLWFSLFCLLLMGFTYFFIRQIIFIAFDPEFSKVNRLPVKMIEYIMLTFIAIGIVLSIRMIGIVLLMSVLTLPQIISNIFFNDYIKIIISSVFVSVIGCTGGLFISYFLNVPAGACIVLILSVIFIVAKSAFFITNKSAMKKQ